MATALTRLREQFLETLGSRFSDHIRSVASDEDIDLELLYDLMLADEDKLADALNWAIISFDQAMRRPWTEHGYLVAKG